MQLLKQSTTVNIKFGPFLDATDGYTAETALTPTVKLAKNAGSLAARNSATATAHDADGYYTVELNTTDTGTLGRLLACTAGSSTHLAVWQEYMVLPANVYDSLVGGSDTLQVDVSQFGNSNGTFSGGRPEVNTTHAAGTAWGSGAITAASIAADAIGASELAADAATEIADAILSRSVSTVEGTAAEHTLCTVILAMLEHAISGTTLTIKRTDGSTTHYTKTLTTASSADAITGIT